MTSRAARQSSTQAVDLLPWADPYILQLFAEAEMVRHEEDECADWEESTVRVHEAGPASVETVLTHDSWRITPLRRSSVSRRRRTESAPRLAPC